MARVVRDRTGEVGAFAVGFLHVVGQALRTFADRAIVDRVTADRIHAPTASPRAKGNNGPKSVVECLPLFAFDVLGNLLGVFGVTRLGEPNADILTGACGDLLVGGCLIDGSQKCFVGHVVCGVTMGHVAGT